MPRAKPRPPISVRLAYDDWQVILGAITAFQVQLEAIKDCDVSQSVARLNEVYEKVRDSARKQADREEGT